MTKYLLRELKEDLTRAMNRSPSVALLGPRQCGKSTFAKQFIKDKNAYYLDLQSPIDRNKLSNPELFFQNHKDQLVCLDEIQRVPELFSLLRSIIDNDRREGRFLFLGSASRDLIKQSKESLAGRIAYLEMGPFTANEIENEYSQTNYLLKGGFPESLRHNVEDSFDWRNDFINTFLERDIPSLGFNIPMPLMHRLWQMLAHYHGQTLNFEKLSSSLSLDTRTIKSYISILEQTYMLRSLPPFHGNLKKRLIKSHKYYLRDHGLLHALLGITNYDELLGHPVVGASWEGIVIENLLRSLPRWEAFFLRTSNQAEVDLVLTKGLKKVFVECKFSTAPKKTRGLMSLIEEVKPAKTFLVAPVLESYDIEENIKVSNIKDVLSEIKKIEKNT